MTQSELKRVARIGAELGAAKAEMERLSHKLERARDHLTHARHDVEIRANAGNDAARLVLKGIDQWLSDYDQSPDDTYTATDMINQSAQAFRDGQAAQVSYPDFRPQLSALVKACQRYIDSDGAECFPDDALIEATVALERDAHAASVRYAARPAQPEQSETVLVPVSVIEEAAHMLEAHSPGSGSVESFTAQDLRAALSAQGESHE